jgi:dTDP-4-dehydrorhamnose reductase
MKVLILGANGMLGHMVANHFMALPYDVTYTVNSFTPDILPQNRCLPFNAVTDDPAKLPRADYIINCIGMIKQKADVPPELYAAVNGTFPHKLGQAERGKVIHITTDCVYSGSRGEYVETDAHDAEDDYGKSKSRGESRAVMCVRTSIIGPELKTTYGLLEFVRHAPPPLRGYTNHWWNGITTKQFAVVCEQIIENDIWAPGLSHIFSPRDVSKYELVKVINEVYGLDKEVIPHQTTVSVNRTLRTIRGLCRTLKIPDIAEQLRTLRPAGGRAAAA